MVIGIIRKKLLSKLCQTSYLECMSFIKIRFNTFFPKGEYPSTTLNPQTIPPTKPPKPSKTIPPNQRVGTELRTEARVAFQVKTLCFCEELQGPLPLCSRMTCCDGRVIRQDVPCGQTAEGRPEIGGLGWVSLFWGRVPKRLLLGEKVIYMYVKYVYMSGVSCN